MTTFPANLFRAICRRGAGLSIPLLIILAAASYLSCHQKPHQPQAEKAVEPTPPPVVKKNPLEWPSPVVGKPYYGTGVVTFINLKEGWIEIEHEEIKDLMPAMTMEFWVKDRSLLKSVRVGDKVDFTVVETGSGQYITELKRVPTTH